MAGRRSREAGWAFISRIYFIFYLLLVKLLLYCSNRRCGLRRRCGLGRQGWRADGRMTWPASIACTCGDLSWNSRVRGRYVNGVRGAAAAVASLVWGDAGMNGGQGPGGTIGLDHVVSLGVGGCFVVSKVLGGCQLSVSFCLHLGCFFILGLFPPLRPIYFDLSLPHACDARTATSTCVLCYRWLLVNVTRFPAGNIVPKLDPTGLHVVGDTSSRMLRSCSC